MASQKMMTTWLMNLILTNTSMSNCLQLQLQTFSIAISFHAFKYKFYLFSVQEYIYVASHQKIKPQKTNGTYQILKGKKKTKPKK
jgi:hypothetical protein